MKNKFYQIDCIAVLRGLYCYFKNQVYKEWVLPTAKRQLCGTFQSRYQPNEFFSIHIRTQYTWWNTAGDTLDLTWD